MSAPGCFPYLKNLNLANNKLKTLSPITLKNLRHLNLNGNLIESLEDFDGHDKLEHLEMRGNKIQALDGLKKAVMLKALFLA